MPVVGTATILTLVTGGLRTTGAHAAIESHAGVVPCAGQPESSGVAPCHFAVRLSCVEAVFDAPSESFLSDVEPTELAVDIAP